MGGKSELWEIIHMHAGRICNILVGNCNLSAAVLRIVKMENLYIDIFQTVFLLFFDDVN